MKKLAFITQSYKNDYKECALLCESMDRFLPKEIDHFIFVNDEDYDLFLSLHNEHHIVYKKSTILPWWLIRCPFKVLGHHYHISPITIPVREWIIQQICKLGVFEVIGNEYEAVFNIDSESIFMRPLNYSTIIKDNKYLMYKTTNQCEPNYEEYCNAAKNLLHIPTSYNDISKYNYMSTPVCFVQKNLNAMLQEIKKNSIWNSWKIALCNTYRFSENYLYGIFTTYKLQEEQHFSMDKYLFPLINLSQINSTEELKQEIQSKINDQEILGVLLQKSNRKKMNNNYFNFDKIKGTVYNFWNNNI